MLVTITQRAADWLIRWPTHTEPVATAADALDAVKRAGEAGAPLIVITWEPTTRIGRMVVGALQ